MNLADSYRLLGLPAGASFDEIKASYRRLARQYHPDVNPGDQRAKEKFIEVTAAYKFLLAKIEQSPPEHRPNSNGSTSSAPPTPPEPKPAARPVDVKVKRKDPPIQFNSDLSPVERQLKATSYQQLQQLLKEHRYPRAIALVEGLSQRIPHDPEITQWQAIAYQRWGRHLIRERQFDKARIYLKKALRTDPHNRALWAEVEKDFRQMEQIF
jgi:tetratricopeptide (TPR) repeat protein